MMVRMRGSTTLTLILLLTSFSVALRKSEAFDSDLSPTLVPSAYTILNWALRSAPMRRRYILLPK